MAKAKNGRPSFTAQQELPEAVHDVANSIRYSKASGSENRRQFAGALMAWANMVFAGLVLAQVFSERVDVEIMVLGATLWAEAYFIAVMVMKGGGGK